jgi:hypothetical protein
MTIRATTISNASRLWNRPLSIIEEAAAGWPRRLVLQSLGDLADNLWTDEEQFGPRAQLPGSAVSIHRGFALP